MMVELSNSKKALLREYYSRLGHKPCFSCGRVLGLADFNKSNGTADGKQGKCRSCDSASGKEWKRRRAAHVREYMARYMAEYMPEYRDRTASKRMEYSAEYGKKNRHKVAAKNAVGRAVSGGKIERPTECSSCGVECSPDGHHWSYDKENWLDVEWLCRSCHMISHSAESKQRECGCG